MEWVFKAVQQYFHPSCPTRRKMEKVRVRVGEERRAKEEEGS